MHVQQLKIENIRSIREFDLDLRDDETTAGWHVLLGDNGSGKSTVVRALALALMGEANALATRQDWSRWLAAGSEAGQIRVQLRAHEERDRWSGQGAISRQPVKSRVQIAAASDGSARNGSRAAIKFSGPYAGRTVWGAGSGWFSASFGAFRRFSGSDPEMDRLYLTHPQLAAHLSAFGENVALGESLRWLRDLQIKRLEGDDEAKKIKRAVIAFVDDSGLLPHGARIEKVTSERVMVADGRGARVDVEDMSDGYRSILSLIFELLRLLFATSGAEAALSSIDRDKATVSLPGVVTIDEIDAHLHPEWQKRISDWFVNRFPETQFIVTTHSPIACRAAAPPHGSVWLLPAPDSGESPRRVAGSDLDRLVDGDVLDAYGTGLFGEDVTRSERSKEKRARLAQLNRKRLREPLSDDERRERDRLRAALPSDPVVTAPPGD